MIFTSIQLFFVALATYTNEKYGTINISVSKFKLAV